MGKGEFTITCPNESIIEANHMKFGMIPSEQQVKDSCTQKGVDHVAIKNNLKNCTATLNEKATRARIIKEC